MPLLREPLPVRHEDDDAPLPLPLPTGTAACGGRTPSSSQCGCRHDGTAARSAAPLLPPSTARFGTSPETWPAEAEFILSALEAGKVPSLDRRNKDRVVYHTLAELRLYSDEKGAAAWVLYSRDVGLRGLGFITRHRLPLGYGGVLRVYGPKGEELTIDCTVRRCREAVNGWCEGALSFNREQWALAPERFAGAQEAKKR